jgi:hypothetical protein
MQTKISDPEAVVESLAGTITENQGSRRELAEQIAAQFPGLAAQDIEEILGHPLQESPRERASQIACLIVAGKFTARQVLAGEPIVSGMVAVDRQGKVLFAGRIGGAL